ncbi:glycosyltransferase family 39 protein [Patescibacteria group bacterium]
MKRFFLPLIFVLGLLLRVMFLARFPIGFTPDEASFGYDAYSILKTGKDQWGVELPLVLKSFGDYKAPLQTYLQIPFIALGGLNKITVRLPNAIFGSFSVLATYLLVKEIRKKHFDIKSNFPELLSALFVAISPWHVMMSRGAFEANLTTFLIPLGIYCFLKALEKEKYLILSTIIFGLNLFSYHSAKFVTPLLVGFLILFYKKDVKKISLKKLLLSLGIFSVFIGLMLYTFSLGAGKRAADVNILKGSLQSAAKERIDVVNSGVNPFLARVIYNKYFFALKRLSSNYSQYFSPQFLFVNGAAETTYGMNPGRGTLYMVETIFIISFILFGFKYFKGFLPIIFWLLISPIPAALSSGPGFAANRAVIMIPAIQIISAFGLWLLIDKIKSYKYLKVVKISILSVFIVSFLYFVQEYFFLSPTKQAKGMLNGNLEVSYWLKENSEEYSQVVVSKRLSEPHIFLAFAEKYDPQKYQEESKNWNFEDLELSWVDQIPNYSLGRYLFRNVDLPIDRKRINSLLIGRKEEFTEEIIPIMQFKYPDGETSIMVVDTNQNLYAKVN